MTGRWRRGWSDPVRRPLRIAAISVAGNLAMAAWKVALGAAAPSLLLVMVGMFNVGVAVAKIVVLRGVASEASERPPYRAYRRSGAVLVAFALPFLTVCGLAAAGLGGHGAYDLPVAIAIAAVTFFEAGLAVHGILSARRQRSAAVEAVKWVNLSGALILLVLTQDALRIASGADPGDVARAGGMMGLACGAAVALIGGMMLARGPRWLARAVPSGR